jgi:hypothetical protein
MSNLAGVVFIKDSEPILFAILAQGNRIWEHKQMADQLIAETLHDQQPAPLFTDKDTRRQLLPPNNMRIEQRSEISGQKLVKAASGAEPRSGDR